MSSCAGAQIEYQQRSLLQLFILQYCSELLLSCAPPESTIEEEDEEGNRQNLIQGKLICQQRCRARRESAVTRFRFSAPRTVLAAAPKPWRSERWARSQGMDVLHRVLNTIQFLHKKIILYSTCCRRPDARRLEQEPSTVLDCTVQFLHKKIILYSTCCRRPDARHLEQEPSTVLYWTVLYCKGAVRCTVQYSTAAGTLPVTAGTSLSASWPLQLPRQRQWQPRRPVWESFG